MATIRGEWMLVAATTGDRGFVVAADGEIVTEAWSLAVLDHGGSPVEYDEMILDDLPDDPGLWVFVPTHTEARAPYGDPATGGPDDIEYLRGAWHKAAGWWLLATDIVPAVLSRVLNQRKGNEG